MRTGLFTIALATLLSACTIPVVASSPRPNVDVDQVSQTLVLVIDDSIKDAYQIPQQQAIAAVDVSGWRSTLQAGYDSGVAPASGSGPDKLEVRLMRADLTFSSAAVTAEGAAVAARAQVTFQARLVDADGRVLRKSSGTAIAKTAVTSKGEATSNASGAVESMWELIVADLFGGPIAPSDAGGLNDDVDGSGEASAPGAAATKAPGS